MSTNLLLLGNSNLLELRGLRNQTSGEFANDALVVATIHDGDAELGGMTWPQTLGYVADSDGVYRLVLDAALPLADGKRYRVVVDAQGDGLTYHSETWVAALVRRD